jgi:DNA-binding response OmpR family regulator
MGGWEAVMSSRQRAILIVEDQASIALNIEHVVRSIEGCSVGHAARLSDALTLIETGSWDAALLDIKLIRGETAYPAAERLRAKGIPFAFLTALDGDIDEQYADVLVLRKPFGETELESCLRMLLMSKMPHPVSEEEEEAAA